MRSNESIMRKIHWRRSKVSSAAGLEFREKKGLWVVVNAQLDSKCSEKGTF